MRACRSSTKCAAVIALGRAIALVLALLLGLSAARADDVAAFYRGRQIDLIVGYGPGGGYDIYARVIAQYLGKYIPGNPTVVVQNMPGAGSLRAGQLPIYTARRRTAR